MYKILLAEDSYYTASAIKIILESNGFLTEHVDDGAKVFDTLKKAKYDLIILDLMLPNVSGEELFKRIKNDDKTKNIPVLILTARIDIYQWSDELKKAEKFMRKPFDNNELLNNVRDCLGLHDKK